MNANNMIHDTDFVSRDRIVTETDTNFFVEAGAGSGKTTMLVRRMVAMVEQGKKISDICAITFTKAAAGEFYERFQNMLIQRSQAEEISSEQRLPGQLPATTEESRSRCQKALQNIDLCFMGTIDSFCNMILSEHPSEAGLPSDSAILSDGEAELLYKQIYIRICSGEFGEELAAEARAFRHFYSKAEEVFIKGASVLMNNRNSEFQFHRVPGNDLDVQFAEMRDRLNDVLNFLLAHPELQYTDEKKSVAAWQKLSEAVLVIRRKWSTNFESVLYALKTVKDLRLLAVAEDHYPHTLGEFFTLCGSKKKWLATTLGSENGLVEQLVEARYSVSMSFLLKCVPILESELKEKGRLSYFDYLYHLRNMLKKSAEGDGSLIRYIGNRHKYFLVDEFQDTNPLQAEVLFHLSARTPAPDWRQCIPKPGSLFIVGDPKQSIYRFRSADVSAFLSVKNLFAENAGDILYLLRNFRSTRMLCQYFNQTFTKMLPEETENQSRYEEIPLPEKDADEFQGIFSYKAYTGNAVEQHPDETDWKQIGRIIGTLVNNAAFTITDGTNTEPRKIRYDDIMVITSSKGKLVPIMEHLDTLGIPTRVEGKVSFETNEALRAVYQIYAAVVDQHDSIAAYDAMTGALIRATSGEVFHYVKNGGRVSLSAQEETESELDESLQFLQDSRIKLHELIRRRNSLSPAALFSEILELYRIFRVVAADKLEVLYYSLELLRAAEQSGEVITASDGSKFIQSLLEGNSDQERCLKLDSKQDCVHMANLHKVKGLEAPVVILAAATDGTSKADMRTEHMPGASKGYLFKLNGGKYENGGDKTYFETKEYSDKKSAEEEALQAENLRLVYVAATRAKNALIVCNSVRLMKGKEVPNSKWKPLLETGTADFFASFDEARQVEAESPLGVSARQLYDEADESCALNNRSSEETTFQVQNPSHDKAHSRLEEPVEANDLTAEESSQSAADNVWKYPALLGTMVHKLMEIIVSSRNSFPVDVLAKEIIDEYCPQIGLDNSDNLFDVLCKTAHTICNGGYSQTNGAPQDILKVLLSADECYCEVPFCYRDDQDGSVTLWNGIIDVLYKSDGQWHVIDYKTNADGNSLDIKYQGQLNAYKCAIKESTGIAVADALTYHIIINA